MPASDEDLELLRIIKAGVAHRVSVRERRNYGFFRKWWALARWAFEHWHEDASAVEYMGQQVVRSFDRFRKDLIILAGFYQPVFGIGGTVMLDAESIAWDKMTEEQFHKLYSATLDVVLKHLAVTDADRKQMQSEIDEAVLFS